MAQPIPWRREVKGAEIHWSAPSSLGYRKSLEQDSVIMYYANFCYLSDNYCHHVHVYVRMCVYQRVQGTQHVNGDLISVKRGSVLRGRGSPTPITYSLKHTHTQEKFGPDSHRQGSFSRTWSNSELDSTPPSPTSTNVEQQWASHMASRTMEWVPL